MACTIEVTLSSNRAGGLQVEVAEEQEEARQTAVRQTLQRLNMARQDEVEDAVDPTVEMNGHGSEEAS